MRITFEILTVLFFTGLLAGFVDSIAGGGGLITLPVLLSIGYNPQMALGTNKLQGTCGVFTAATNFIRQGKVNLKECGFGVMTTLMGASTGAFVVQLMNPNLLGRVVPFLLLAVFIYTVFSRKLGQVDQQPKIHPLAYYALFGLLLGFYDGFFGPGTGAFWTAGLLYFLGYNFTKAIGVTKMMNFTSNFVALVLFAVSGNVDIWAGSAMAAGQIIGARAGSNMAIKKGAGFIRPIFISVVLITMVHLFYRNFYATMAGHR